jgi:hypothetical protein
MFGDSAAETCCAKAVAIRKARPAEILAIRFIKESPVMESALAGSK